MAKCIEAREKLFTTNMAASHIWSRDLVLSRDNTHASLLTSVQRNNQFICAKKKKEKKKKKRKIIKKLNFKIIHSESFTRRSEINVWHRKAYYNVVMKYLQIDCVTKFTNCFIIHM